MSYHTPTSDGILFAVESGVDWDTAKRGYDIFDYENLGVLHIERIDIAYIGTEHEDVTDLDCAAEAQRTGFCKLIPEKELPKGLGDLKYYGWLDTPENRKRLAWLVHEKETW